MVIVSRLVKHGLNCQFYVIEWLIWEKKRIHTTFLLPVKWIVRAYFSVIYRPFGNWKAKLRFWNSFYLTQKILLTEQYVYKLATGLIRDSFLRRVIVKSRTFLRHHDPFSEVIIYIVLSKLRLITLLRYEQRDFRSDDKCRASYIISPSGYERLALFQESVVLWHVVNS